MLQKKTFFVNLFESLVLLTEETAPGPGHTAVFTGFQLGYQFHLKCFTIRSCILRRFSPPPVFGYTVITCRDENRPRLAPPPERRHIQHHE